MAEALKVLFSCTGVGVFNRGIETFFREAFDGLRGMPGVDMRLLKGAGESAPGEETVWCLPRTGTAAHWIGRTVRRSAYTVEQLSSFLPVLMRIRSWRPDVIYYSDANLGFQLFHWRQLIGVPYRLLFSNGAPLRPPFERFDFIHQVTPVLHAEALAAGEVPERHTFVPYGIRVPAGEPITNPEDKAAIRKRLFLPVDRRIILSTGWISATQKRMDYLIEEVAELPAPRPFLVLLGAIDAASVPVLQMARERLGADGFVARSVPYDAVTDYYNAADEFCLASISEGFGRVYLEALIHGLPLAAHNGPVMQYVIGRDGTLADLRVRGALAAVLARMIALPPDVGAAQRRRESVRRRFAWEVLSDQYRKMFFACLSHTLVGQ